MIINGRNFREFLPFVFVGKQYSRQKKKYSREAFANWKTFIDLLYPQSVP